MIWSHTFTVFRDTRSQLDLSDREKCFIKHKNLHFLIPNVNIMYEKLIKITYHMFLVACSAFLCHFQSLATDTLDYVLVGDVRLMFILIQYLFLYAGVSTVLEISISQLIKSLNESVFFSNAAFHNAKSLLVWNFELNHKNDLSIYISVMLTNLLPLLCFWCYNVLVICLCIIYMHMTLFLYVLVNSKR